MASGVVRSGLKSNLEFATLQGSGDQSRHAITALRACFKRYVLQLSGHVYSMSRHDLTSSRCAQRKRHVGRPIVEAQLSTALDHYTWPHDKPYVPRVVNLSLDVTCVLLV